MTTRTAVTARRNLFDLLPVPVFMCTRDGAVIDANAALREVVGGVDPVGRDCWTWLRSDESAEALPDELERRLVTAPHGFEHDVLVHRTDGAPAAGRLTVRPVDDDALLIVLRVVDAEIRQAVKLRASQERFEKLAQNVPAGILSSQAGMRVDYANQRCCDVLGAAAEHLLGFGWLDYVHPDDAIDAESAVAEVIATSTEAALPLRLQRSDGTQGWAEMRVAPVRAARDVGFVATIEDVTAARRLNDELTFQARRDPLTGLPNRTALHELLVERLDDGRRRFAVLFVDLDHFKDVNDSLGHGVGDELLVVTAERVRRCAGPGDVVTRFGGDEFVVVSEPADDDADVERLAQRIVDAMREPIEVSGATAIVSASVGIVHALRSDAQPDSSDPHTLLRDADIAMYQAKRAGRNQIATFDERARATSRERLFLHAALDRAIEQRDGALSLEYQPIISLVDGRMLGVEALMRWDLTMHGRIPPATFIPLAEETGLVARLDRIAIDTALAHLAQWRTLSGGEELWVAVNLSARDLHEVDLVDAIGVRLRRFDLPGAALHVELTESAVMDDPERAIEILGQLQRLGVRVSIDDFGTGHSSLAYLQRLPVDSVKIDRAFVERLGVDAAATSLIEAMVAMSAALGLTVVAEGVETADQADQLRDIGAKLAQGYHFDRPLVADALTDRIARR